MGLSWEALGVQNVPRGWGTLTQDDFLLTFLVFVAALSISFNLGGLGSDFGRVLGRFGMVLGWFGEGFWVDLMLSFSFSWLHFPCGCHFLGHSIWPGGMREAIRRPTAGGAAC